MHRPRIALSMNYMQLGSYHQYHIRDTYINALYGNGAQPLLIPCIPDKDILRDYLSLAGALVIIGGMDYPPSLYGEEPHPELDPAHERRVQADMLLVETALEMKKPLLGICAGMQLLNIYFGGKLIQHIAELDTHFGEKYHPIQILGGRWLPQMYAQKEILVKSNHHQGINPLYIGRGLTVTAQSHDGMIEALEYESEQMVLGIQWHPERIADPEVSRPVFEFLNKLSHNEG